MKLLDERFVYDEISDNNHMTVNNTFYDSPMISRKERNRRKASIKVSKRKKGKRYKKKTYFLKVNLDLKEKNKYIVIITATLAAGAAISSHIYFKHHFYIGSTINCISVSGKSVQEAEKIIEESIENYSLTLQGRNGQTIVLSGRDFDLKYNPNKIDEIQYIKESQNESFWIKSLFKDENKDGNNILVTYNEELLDKLVDNSDLFNEDNVIKPENPKFVYENNEFQIRDEVYGNKIKKDVLIDEIKKSILCGKENLDIEELNCYEEPDFTKSSDKAVKIKNILNQYKNAQIKYSFGDHEEILDMSTMGNWIEIDDNFNESINEDKVKEFVNKLADKYDTVGKERSFTSTSGRTVTVSGGDYGFKIDRTAEVEQIINDLKERKAVQREPVYEQKAINSITDDIKKTCVEIDLTNQHLWFYKDGNIITQGDIVSGSIANGTITPEGTYKLKYKAKDSVLVGEDYRSPVSFWMPFNGNIGMHDASWRSTFGGKIYVSSGSHGCVNLSYRLANDIFYNIEEGTPIVCYY